MSVKRDTVYNLCGSIAPMFVALATVPIYLHLIGNARYGVLAIVWLFLGYFGVFDPGITRAASFHIARLPGPDKARERESVFWTALVVNSAFGLAGGIILYFVARPVFMTFFKMPDGMRAEVLASLPWLAASLPVSITAGVFGGALQARDWFGFSNATKVGNMAISQLAPLAVAYWHGPELTWLIPTVLIARTIGVIPNVIATKWALPLGTGGRLDRRRLKDLFSYGGWVSITNLMAPLLTSVDRLLIGSMLSAEAVAFYTVPFNLVSRASVIPWALASSLFPKLSRGNSEESSRLAADSVLALVAVMTPLIVLGMGALPVFLQVWVGRSFAEHAASLGIILLAGIWINGLAVIPFSHLQATGRPNIVAKFHAYEFVPFIILLWFGLHWLGLLGAAWAWTIRVSFDAALLFIADGTIPNWRRLIPGGLIIAAAACVAPTSILSVRTVLEFGVLLVATAWSWRLSPAVRAMVRGWAGMTRIRAAV